MLGIDLVEIAQIKLIYQKHRLNFLEKILDRNELNDLPAANSQQFFKRLGCYIAAKEAVFKACSEYNLDWQDISIRDISQDPRVRIKKIGVKVKIALSLMAAKDIILSQAILIQN